MGTDDAKTKEKIKFPPKEYLGDGVYASFDGLYIWLETLEGMKIALEPEVQVALDRYKESLIIFYAGGYQSGE